ncbi:MAG TPA: hypothetical protein VNS58_23510 [Puia sp.]|nr:hypothetical protein [Puia sp.]
MRQISTLITTIVLSISSITYSSAQTYTVNANTTWTALTSSASWCGSCTFTIAAGVTLTLDQNNPTCGTCTFTGGNIVAAQNFSCQSCTFSGNNITINSTQLSLQSSTTSFTNTIVSLAGTGSISASAPVTVTNSTFTFQGSSNFLNGGGSLTLTNSIFYFNGNAYFSTTSGPINLITNSSLVAGDGSSTSNAYILMNTSSPINIYDNSSVKIANNNNYYFDWSSYYSVSNSTTYTTTNNSFNCNGSYPHACSAPYVYGCATLTKSGPLACITLAVTDLNFSAVQSGLQSVDLSWSTGQETNTDHFTVQRSANGNDWESIGIVTAKGYAYTTSNYRFSDPSARNGMNDYRLQIYDKDGKSTYSRMVAVTIAGTAGEISIYPSPVTDQTFHLKAPSTEALVVNVFTMSGQLLWVTSLKGQLVYQIKLPSTIAHNNYIVVQVISNEKTQAFTLLNQ